jgi:flagellar motor switch protein FliN/FliY
MSSKLLNAIELPPLAARGGDEKSAVLGERLDLVEHVKVKVHVTLGGAEMALGKLFALAAGDVVTLDCDVDALVDVRLHDKLIARGQLVAVGDKFGVRVVEILA